MSKRTVLMYHAIGGAGTATDPADAHYTVTHPAFSQQLKLLRALNLRISSVARILEQKVQEDVVAFTFDDGHASNEGAAAEILEQGGSADLFVNPAVVGQPHFLDWPALRGLANAGISIQSHGHTHRYFNELADSEVEYELATSKAAIEDQIGKPVTLFAPPGGRLNPRVAGIAERLGYVGICSSKAGIWQSADGNWMIPRLAVLHSTNEAQFLRWVRQDAGEFARMAARDRILSLAKRLLGNSGYEKLRARLLKNHKEEAA